MNKYLVLILLFFSLCGCDGQSDQATTDEEIVIEDTTGGDKVSDDATGGDTAPEDTSDDGTSDDGTTGDDISDDDTTADDTSDDDTTDDDTGGGDIIIDAGEITLQEMEQGYCTLTGVVESNNAGFTGVGFSNTDNAVDAKIKWQVNATTAGDYAVELVYAATSDRPATLSSNGSLTTVGFVSSTAWDVWATDTATISLAAGENDIILNATTDSGAPNIDYLKITGLGLTAGACTFVETVADAIDTQVFIIGDSTVANYGTSYYPQTGWGQVFQYYFDDTEIEVLNRARGGRSSRSYYTEVGLWDEVIKEIDTGDYLFIQFGHNDRDWSKEERYTAPADFEIYLSNYVNEARAKGAIPVLVSPMVMNAYSNDVLRNVFTEDGNDYRGAMLNVANTLDVAFIDLNMKSFDLVNTLGMEQASHYLYLILDAGEYENYPDGKADGTHFQESGAVEMSRLVVEGLEELNARTNLKPLLDHVKYRYTLDVEDLGATASIISQGFAYPKDIPLTVKTRAGDSDTFNAWYQFGQNVSDDNIYQFTMPANNTTLVAAFNGEVPVVNFDAATVFIIGDSTVANYTAGYYPQTGWGQVLQPFFDDTKITIDNRALGGRSSKSFYNDHWADVKANISAGDFVFIQFGINDRSSDENRTAPTGGVFEGYMTSFVTETQALGATPVFVSSVRRNQWADGVPYDAYHEHPVVTRELAATLDVALIDLDSKNKALLESVGESYANNFYYMGFAAGEYANFANGSSDTVHFQEAGAVEMARLVREGVSELSSNEDFAPLIDALTPLHALTVTSPTPEAGTFTQGFAYPQGTPLTLKVLANSGNVFTQWLDENSAEVSDAAIYQFTAGTSAEQYAAVFNNSEGLGVASTNLSATLNGFTVDLSWSLQNYDPTVTALDLYRNEQNSTTGSTLIKADVATTSTFTDDSVEEGKTYWYMFKVTQGTATTTSAPEAEITIPLVSEVPVTNLVAVADGVDVTVTWDLQNFTPDITYLELYRNDKEQAVGRTRVLAGIELSGSIVDKGLEPGKTYWYMFKMQQDGEFVNTDPEAETTIAGDAVVTDPVDPAEPPVTNLATTVDGTSVTVSWDLQNVEEGTYIELHRNSKNDIYGRSRVISGAAMSGSFVDEGVESGKTYWYMFKLVKDGVTTNTDPESETIIP